LPRLRERCHIPHCWRVAAGSRTSVSRYQAASPCCPARSQRRLAVRTCPKTSLARQSWRLPASPPHSRTWRRLRKTHCMLRVYVVDATAEAFGQAVTPLRDCSGTRCPASRRLASRHSISRKSRSRLKWRCVSLEAGNTGHGHRTSAGVSWLVLRSARRSLRDRYFNAKRYIAYRPLHLLRPDSSLRRSSQFK
jgi:hypothetical protein